MAQYSKLSVLNKIHRQGVIPLFYHHDVDVCKAILKACYEGGARLLEFTNRGDFAHEVFREMNKYALSELPGMILGVGSITDGAVASMYLQLGANFVVTPCLREDIAIVCNRKKVPFMPGCASLTEIGKAEELGCDIVKLFPGNIYGPDFIKAVKGPQPWTNIMPTGGVSTDKSNLESWFQAGAACVGLGSKLISKEVIQNKEYTKIATSVNEVLKLIEGIRLEF